MRTRQDIYRTFEYCTLFVAGFLIITLTMTSLPDRARAFWFFSSNADAATNTVIPSSSTPVLTASINRNPNVGAPIALATSGGTALLSYNGPSGTIASVANATHPGRISVYVVRPGDTLSEIADMFNVSVNTIIWANNLSSAKDVHPGDTLVMLPVSGVERTVVKGDTLKSLAKKYDADAGEIAQYNGLDPADSLVIGSVLIIPGGEMAVVAPKSSSVRSVYEPYLGGSGSVQNGYYINPVPGAVTTQALHGWNGIDLGAARGTPIRAAASGTAIIARNGGWNGGYGSYVVITHANSSQTLYSHMARTTVSTGQFVASGQVIGYVGSTGQSTGPHLHFEVRGAANPLRNCLVGRICSAQ